MYMFSHVMDEVVFGYFHLDPLGDHQGPARGRLGKDDCELLSPVPREDVGGAGAFPQQASDIPKREISGRMAEPVIELLEIVHVDHEEGQCMPVPAGALEFPPKRLIEFSMIEKTC